MDLSIHIDGGARGNPGPAAIAVVLKDVDANATVHEGGYFIGRATNNVAEYRALTLALELALERQATQVRIHSDSELLVKQITGEYRVKSPDLIPLHETAQRLLLRFNTWQIRHVYRQENMRADQLVNMALDAGKDVVLTPGIPGTTGSGNGTTGAPKGDDPARADTPRWTVRLSSKPESPCPAGCVVGQRYAFGPGTPAGFCVYATQVVFDGHPVAGVVEQATLRCGRCGAMVRIEPDQP